MKFAIKADIQFDTDPDGENERGKSFISPELLMIAMPYISRLVRDIMIVRPKPPEQPAASSDGASDFGFPPNGESASA